MISRGIFTPETATTPGKARDWTANDVVALILFERFFSRGMPPEQAQALSYLISPGALGGKLLVVWPDPKHNAGGWTHDVVDRRSLSRFLKEEAIWEGVVIDIDAVAERALDAIEQATVAGG